MTWVEAIPYFTKHELACKGSGIVEMDARFAVMLPYLRLKWGKTLSLSSVCRSPQHNTNVGGHPNSLHLTYNPKHKTNGTMAADVTWKNWPKDEQIAFAKLAYDVGFSVGLHNAFCHIDLREEIGLPKIVFLYGTWDGRFKPSDIA
ncbi:MAG: hypothetical protein CTY37_05330 [Methylotenera sp.]|nr:MAG: hypothetical protein CTY37_05330 [Methylotenera sp.]